MHQDMLDNLFQVGVWSTSDDVVLEVYEISTYIGPLKVKQTHRRASDAWH